MTADEIRKTELGHDWTEPWENFADACFGMLREIAAQLAELNERMQPGNLIVNACDITEER